MNYKKDYYSILSVGKKATRETIRDAYRRLAKLHHPDKNPGDPGAEERFKAINEAYEVLSNEITRNTYDSYRATDKKDQSQEKQEHQTAQNAYKPFTTTKTRTYTVNRGKRIYIKGTIEAKFQGAPELLDTYTRQREQQYIIDPTEVLVTIFSTDIYNGEVPNEYQQGFDSTDLFSTPLQQPVICRIITAGREKYYQLELYDVRVKDPVLKDITRHDQYSFGTLKGTVYGYVLQLDEEEVTETYTEYSGPTGQFETKTEAGYNYSRQQFYTANGGTYWTEWKRNTTYTWKYNNDKTVNPVSRVRDNNAFDWSWVIVLLLMIAIWPKLLFIIIPFAAGLLLLLLLGWIIAAFDKIIPWVGAAAIALLVILAIGSLSHDTGRRIIKTTSIRNSDSVSSEKKVIRAQDHQEDTLISHTVHWQDRDSTRYTIQFSILTSALNKSIAAHNQMDIQQYSTWGIGAVYRDMLDTDHVNTTPVAAAFDSLAGLRYLNGLQKASMVVSCIQSIPYTLIVDNSCSDNYNDDFIQQYLAQCKKDCCKGYSKFGVQSPVEFMGDLKGDCDTRALFLYDILRKLGYKVALMTSSYYKHALIAVCLDKKVNNNETVININGETYFLWETTAKNFGPGELPATVSNINYWDIALIQ